MLNLKIKEWPNEKNYSKNTYDQYYFTIKQFKQLYGEKFTKNNIRAYKSFLIENFKPKTVNIRLVALNSFLKYIGKLDLLSEGIKIQQKPFILERESTFSARLLTVLLHFSDRLINKNLRKCE